MRRLATWLFCLFVLAQQGTHAAPTLKDDPSKTEIMKLEGTWRVESVTLSGIGLVEESIKNYPNIIVKMTDKRLEYSFGSNGPSGTIIRLDPKSKPKEIDYLISSRDGKETRQLGIYELDGDTYRECLAPRGKPRPKTFESTAENGNSLMVQKRVKAEK